MNDDDLLRYSRQIMLSELDIEGQQKLRDAHALIIGLGGLGSPVSMYLTAAGFGQLTLVDDDQVDMTNLQRQIVHDTSTVGQDKVASAKAHLARLNSDVVVHAINRRLSDDELNKKIAEVDIVIDCCDNFDTRFAVNLSCYQHQTPLVSVQPFAGKARSACFILNQIKRVITAFTAKAWKHRCAVARTA